MRWCAGCGQASFGAADHNQLSEWGARQCHELGRYSSANGQRFEAVLRGNLKRHLLQSFNHTPHLDRADRDAWLTYA